MSKGKHTAQDGDHRTGAAGVIVTPLTPPFPPDVVIWRFHDNAGGKRLAISAEDAEKLKALLNGTVEGRAIRMSAVEGSETQIKVSIGKMSEL